MNEVERECREHFNEPVIAAMELARLIGFAERERDLYYIIRSPSRGDYFHTGVGGVIFLSALRGQGEVISHNGEKWDDFYRLDQDLELNRAPKVSEFIYDSKPEE